MAWIKTIDYEEAEGPLKQIYKRVKGPDNNVDNVLKIHSLRPHTLKGHMQLYKNVLHNSNNELPKWYLECLGVYVSGLNNCDYCVQHHRVGMHKCLGDDNKFAQIENYLKEGIKTSVLTEKELAGIAYAKKITLELATVSQHDIEQLHSVGFDDGDILEINQVVSYFNYVNRTVVGLGVNTDGDILGLSPNESEDPNNWSHK